MKITVELNINGRIHPAGDPFNDWSEVYYYLSEDLGPIDWRVAITVDGIRVPFEGYISIDEALDYVHESWQA